MENEQKNAWLSGSSSRLNIIGRHGDTETWKEKTRMEIYYRDIILRDYRESDIEDDIRWNTVETEWALWDAPWETEEDLASFDPQSFREEEMEGLKKAPQGFRWSLELDTSEGMHIGGVNAYLIDEDFQWIHEKDLKPGQKSFPALGVEVNESSCWGRGLGTQGLAAYIRYFLDNGKRELYLQTWSGNFRMLRCAEKLGFTECNRIVGMRHVRGAVYDGLTFKLDVEKFEKMFPS